MTRRLEAPTIDELADQLEHAAGLLQQLPPDAPRQDLIGEAWVEVEAVRDQLRFWAHDIRTGVTP